MKIENFNDIFNYYDSTDSRFLYIDKKFDNRGIDYTSFIKLRYESINEKHITNIYTLDGWYILWYLLGNSYNGIYIKTTISEIAKDIKYKTSDIIPILKNLEKQNIVKINNKSFNNNTLLTIAIGYNEDNVIQNKTNGYVSIPKDFIRIVLPSLNKTQWAIFTILCVRYNYIYPSSRFDERSQRELYYTKINCYAFPTQEQIAELLDIKDNKTIRSHLKKLEENKYKLIKINKIELKDGGYEVFFDNEENKNKIKRFNNKYYIYLFERMEYGYNCIYNIPDERKENNKYKEFFNELKKKGLDYVMESDMNKYLTKKDFVEYRFKNFMGDYKKCVETNDYEQYKILKFNKIQIEEPIKENNSHLKLKKYNTSITEKELEDYLINNLNLVEEGMTLVDNQYSTEFGRIDILAKDKNNKYCIIELKVKDDDKRLITQCLTYPLSFNNSRMITIAPEYRDFLLKPLLEIPNIEVYNYNIINKDLQTLEINKIN